MFQKNKIFQTKFFVKNFSHTTFNYLTTVFLKNATRIKTENEKRNLLALEKNTRTKNSLRKITKKISGLND